MAAEKMGPASMNADVEKFPQFEAHDVAMKKHSAGHQAHHEMIAEHKAGHMGRTNTLITQRLLP